MRKLSRLFCLLCAGLLTVACGSDDDGDEPGGGGSTPDLSVTTPVVSNV